MMANFVLGNLGNRRTYSKNLQDLLSIVAGGIDKYKYTVASEAYHDWSGEAAGARLHVNFMLKLLPSHNFRNRPLMRFINFAFSIGPAAVVPVGPAPAPLV